MTLVFASYWTWLNRTGFHMDKAGARNVILEISDARTYMRKSEVSRFCNGHCQGFAGTVPPPPWQVATWHAKLHAAHPTPQAMLITLPHSCHVWTSGWRHGRDTLTWPVWAQCGCLSTRGTGTRCRCGCPAATTRSTATAACVNMSSLVRCPLCYSSDVYQPAESAVVPRHPYMSAPALQHCHQLCLWPRHQLQITDMPAGSPPASLAMARTP